MIESPVESRSNRPPRLSGSSVYQMSPAWCATCGAGTPITVQKHSALNHRSMRLPVRGGRQSATLHGRLRAGADTRTAPAHRITRSVLVVLVVTAPPDAALVAALRRAIEKRIGAPDRVDAARVGRVGVIDRVVLAHECAHAGAIAPEGPHINPTACRKLRDRRRWRDLVHRMRVAGEVVFD